MLVGSSSKGQSNFEPILPVNVLGAANKLFRNLQDSIDYMRDLF